MGGDMEPARSPLSRLLLASFVVLSLLVGCDSGKRAGTGSAWFVGEYIDPCAEGGAARLTISGDGTFALRLGDQTDAAAVDGGREVGRGSWVSLGDGVELDGGSWRARLDADEITVSVPERADTLSGLRWTVVSGASPLAVGGFLRYQEFADFVNPPGGFGTSSGGL